MLLSQASFSRLIGVSRKTVTAMKQRDELVMVGKQVDSNGSVEKLIYLGRAFDDKGHLIKDEHVVESKKEDGDKINLLSEEVVPKNNLANMSDDDREKIAKELAYAKKLKEEFESNTDGGAGVDHDEKIRKIDLQESKRIKEYWLGVSIQQKTELLSSELVYRKDIQKELFSIFREMRGKIESLPNNSFKMVGKSIGEIEKIREHEVEEWFKILLGDEYE